MSYSKAHLFPLPDQQTAQLAKAIAHPARIAILRIMAKSEYVEQGFLFSQLPLSSPTVQQHLNYLFKQQIILINTKSARAQYYVNRERFEGLRSIVSHCLSDMT